MFVKQLLSSAIHQADPQEKKKISSKVQYKTAVANLIIIDRQQRKQLQGLESQEANRGMQEKSEDH